MVMHSAGNARQYLYHQSNDRLKIRQGGGEKMFRLPQAGRAVRKWGSVRTATIQQVNKEGRAHG